MTDNASWEQRRPYRTRFEELASRRSSMAGGAAEKGREEARRRFGDQAADQEDHR